MANDTSSRTWFIDTAVNPLYQLQVFVKFVEVIGGSVAPAVGDVLIDIQDRNGKSMVLSRAQVAAIREIQTYNIENWFEGIQIAVIGPNGVTARIHTK